MPGGDRTGPLGNGQLSGRQMGYCAGYDAPGYARGGEFGCGLGRGRGHGRAFGGGRGMAFRYGAAGRCGWPSAPAFGAPPAPPVNEVAQLKSQIDGLEQSLAALRQRLHTVEGEAKE